MHIVAILILTSSLPSPLPADFGLSALDLLIADDITFRSFGPLRLGLGPTQIYNDVTSHAIA